MCPGIEWWEVNEVQISGNKIEPQWPFLDTLGETQQTQLNHPNDCSSRTKRMYRPI
jgi:hypothetical protein